MDIAPRKFLNESEQLAPLIEKASHFGGEIYQAPTLNSPPISSRIFQFKTDPFFARIILRIDASIKVDPLQPIYIQLNYRRVNFILLPGDFKIVGDKIFCRYPHEAYALEERLGERYVLSHPLGTSLSLRRNVRDSKEFTYDLEVCVVDVSVQGFAVQISEFNRNYFCKNDSFLIKSIDHYPLQHPLPGSVSYVTAKKSHLKRSAVRVGLSLKAPLTDNVFDYLKRRSFLVLAA